MLYIVILTTLIEHPVNQGIYNLYQGYHGLSCVININMEMIKDE